MDLTAGVTIDAATDDDDNELLVAE